MKVNRASHSVNSAGLALLGAGLPGPRRPPALRPRTPAILAFLVLPLVALPAAAAKREPCAGGRFLLPAGQPLIEGAAAPVIDAVVLDGDTVAVASGCPAARAKVKARRKGTRVRAKWKKGVCAALGGKVRLLAKLDQTCATLTGKLRAKRFARAFTAQRSACGDGVLDVDGAEDCDGVEGPAETPVLDVLGALDRAPGVDDGEIGPGPGGGLVVRTRLQLALEAGATVGELNALLAGVGGRIVHALDGLPWVVVRIPDPGTAEGLEAVAAQIEASPIVRYVATALVHEAGALPSNVVPGVAGDMATIDHDLAIRAWAAWNARGAVRATDRPAVVVSDHFGDGPPSATHVPAVADLPATDIATGNPHQHGYHVLGTIAAAFGGDPTDTGRVTGMSPVAPRLRVVDRQQSNGTTIDELTIGQRMIAVLQATPGNVILNTSIDLSCHAGRAPRPLAVFQATLAWVEMMRAAALEDRVLHLTCAGNIKPEQCPDEKRAELNSVYTAAALTPLTPTENLRNVLAIENVLHMGGPQFWPLCHHPTSKFGGHLAGIGFNVWSYVDAAGKAEDLNGCSMATPQAAGLAAYLWAIEPSMTVAELRGLLLATATPANRGADCPGNAPAPVIQAYDAVLALDEAVLPTPTTARVRNAILDVNDDGRFDTTDLRTFLGAFVADYVNAANHGAPIQTSTPDYGRYDLNGNAYTGGVGKLPFDLDRVGSTRYGAAALSTVSQQVGGETLTFDEHGLTDLEILCYYAYSSLFQDTATNRAVYLDPALCGATPFDYTQAGGMVFDVCADQAHFERTVGGVTTPGVREDYCLVDQVPSFRDDLLPELADVADNACFMGAVPASTFGFDPQTSMLRGQRDEWDSRFDAFFHAVWTAVVDAGATRIEELTIDKCQDRGAWQNGASHIVLRDLVGQVQPGDPGFVTYDLTGQAVCDAIETFQLQTDLGSMANPDVTTIYTLVCGDDPTSNYLRLRLHGR